MNISKDQYLLYAVTDRKWVGSSTLARQVEDAILGGAGIIQLREKELEENAFIEEAVEIGKLCRRYSVPLIINDNVRVALEAGADGVHVGQSDLDAADVRKMIGDNRILGVSAHSLEEARLAAQHGADYLGVGAAFATGSKADVNVIDHRVYREITGNIQLPVVAIGGITLENISSFEGTGISGIAVISAVFGQPDIRLAAEQLKHEAARVLG